MKACIINIGDELLIGDVANSNAFWMSKELDGCGIVVVSVVVVGDNETDILHAIDEGLIKAEIVLLTGGLGPTHDDITKHCLCRYFNDTLVHSAEVYTDITNLLTRFGRKVEGMNEGQALVPSTCEILRNSAGTAPGMIFRKEGRMVVSMPGVPHEMKLMMGNGVLPLIGTMAGGEIRIHRYLRTFGIAEAALAGKLGALIESLPPFIKLAFLPSPGQVRLRFTASGRKRHELQKELDKAVGSFAGVIGSDQYGVDGDSLASVVGALLRSGGKSLATAESCTGGRIASKITEVAGASDYFLGSVIAYSDDVKSEVLDVDSGLLKKFGAVSEEVVKSMAEAMRKKMGSDYALAVSGIAGPGGGSKNKPVGTIWLALSSSGGCRTRKLSLGFSRGINMDVAADCALDMLRRELQGLT